MKTMWLLLDNRMGSVGQARGVALKLENDFKIIEKPIIYNALAKLPNLLKGASLLGVTAQSKKALSSDFPDVVISASRRTAPIARWIKKHSKKTKIVQIMHPGNAGLKYFDLVFVPYHDKGKTQTPNTYYIYGAPHRITEKKLEEATLKWTKEFANLPRPLTAVLVGGGPNLDKKNASRLGYELKALKDKIGGSILITTSARTGKITEDAILAEIEDVPMYKYLWGQAQDKENPFLGYLACADNIVVTGDSVSMCSEACGAGKPTFVFVGDNWLKEKHCRFIFSLFQRGYACSLDDLNIIDFAPKSTLDCATDIAKKIREMF